MLDARLRRRIDQPLRIVARGLVRCGLTATSVTIIGFAFAIIAWISLAWTEYEIALAAIVLNRVCDGLDGAIARQTAITDVGGFLDIVLDFLFYSGVPFFFAVGQPSVALASSFLIFSFIGTSSSFLTFAIFAEKRNIQTEARGKKSLYYLGGLTEGFETIFVFVVICVWPEWFVIVAWSFGSLCWLTTIVRIIWAVQVFGHHTESTE